MYKKIKHLGGKQKKMPRQRCMACIYSLTLGLRVRNLFLASFINSASEKLSFRISVVHQPFYISIYIFVLLF